MEKKELIKQYAEKYKKISKILSIIFTILIIALGIFMIWLGLIIILNNSFWLMLSIGIILFACTALDIGLAIKFFLFSWKNLKYMPSRRAAERYCKITGNKF